MKFIINNEKSLALSISTTKAVSTWQSTEVVIIIIIMAKLLEKYGFNPVMYEICIEKRRLVGLE